MYFTPIAFVYALLGSFENPPPPPPPLPLKPWVEYAHALNGDAGCPPDLPCLHLSRVAFSGKPATGAITLKISGQNVGKRMAEVPLLSPASEVAVVRAHFTSGKGVVHLGEDNACWLVAAQPGFFSLEAELRFDQQDSLSLELPSPVAAIVDNLAQGSIIFDDTSAQHGGTLFIESGKRDKASHDDVTTRIDRSIVYGGTTTFTYHFAVAGLHEQMRAELPLLGGEAIESLSPDTPYTVQKGTPDTLSVTLTPAAPIVTVTGHFNATVAQLAKPVTNPTEYWLFTSDARHPVDIACDGVEIDPSEVPSLVSQPATRAFMLSENNSLRVTPVVVSVDKGRQGSGSAKLSYIQSGTDTWMSDLTLALQTAPGLDRMVLTSSSAAHYAAVGDSPVRMFDVAVKDAAALSVRVSNALAPMRLQWREQLSTNDWLSFLALRLPGQSVHLDDATAQVSLRPGFVPMSVWGVEYSHGDLLDGITLYAVLLALLGGALARQARLPRWAVMATVILLVGLYSVDAFPHVGVLALLAGTVAFVRLPDVVFVKISERKWASRLVRVVWALVCLSTVLQAIDYAQDRILSALHPWAVADTGQSFPGTFYRGEAALGAAPAAAPSGQATEEDENREAATPLSRPLRKTVRRDAVAPSFKKELVKGRAVAPTTTAPAAVKNQITQLRERTVLPVAFARPDLRTVLFDYGFGALPAGQEAIAHVMLAGPALRGLWIFVECAALAGLIALLLLRSKRLWFAPRTQEVTP